METYTPFNQNVIQFGRESTPGTEVAATYVWRGPATDIVNRKVMKEPGKEENVGLNVDGDRTYISQLMAGLTFPTTEATFEQLPHILEAGIEAVTPTGAGPYVRDYEPSYTSTPNTLKAYTIETGNNVSGEDATMVYGLVTGFRLEGEIGGAWMITPDWIGRDRLTKAKTGSVALETVEEMLFQKTTVFIDDGGGTIGSTQKTGVLVKASINVQTGVIPIFAADGTLYFSSHKIVKPRLTYALTLEVESGGVAAAERAAYDAETVRLIRLHIAGSGTSEMDIDIAGKHTSVGSYENRNQNTVVTMNGEAKYNSTDALLFAFSITNSDAAL